MSKEVETHMCNFCESSFKLTYILENTSGFSKFCPFCGTEVFDDNDDDVDFDE